MVLDRETGRIQHRCFRDIPDLLAPSDCLVINTTRVLPARFLASRRSGGRISGLFVREEAPGSWIVLLAGAGRLKPGETLTLLARPAPTTPSGAAVPETDIRAAPSAWTLTLLSRLERGDCRVRIDPPAPADRVLGDIGLAPLPPYIRRRAACLPDLDRQDRERYQTVYAAQPGAIAAPTAGMHFTADLLRRIRASGTRTADVVLHVGLGTFQPVEVEDLGNHTMHSERYALARDSETEIVRTRAGGGRIIAVGTTSVRVLETCAEHLARDPDDAPSPPPEGRTGSTNLFIYPPYTFRVTDALLTNFHLPGSTLLALVCAFADHERVMAAYRCAIEQGYRFYSYGDAMLIL